MGLYHHEKHEMQIITEVILMTFPIEFLQHYRKERKLSECSSSTKLWQQIEILQGEGTLITEFENVFIAFLNSFPMSSCACC